MRHMRSHIIGVFLALLVIVAIGPADAKDLTLRQRLTTGGPQSASHESMQYWTSDKLITDDPDTRVIIDFAAETMTMVDKQKHTYHTQTFAQMRQRSEAAQADMKKHMESLPPQAREMMDKMGMGSTGAEVAVSVKPTGKSEKIAGYEAKEYAIEVGSMRGSVWATEALQPPGGAKATEAFGRMLGSAGPGAKISQAMLSVKGVPLRTTMSMMGPHGFTTTTEVIEVSEKSPPPDVMQVPAGFKKTEQPEFGGAHAPKGPASP
jgi:hypothetical protein